jgi:hypothetical protein
MITFEINGLRGRRLPVTLVDIVRAITTEYPDLQWAIQEFYGRGSVDVRYPGNRSYREFSEYLGRPILLSTDELMKAALATDDIYDILMLGTRRGEVPAQYRCRNPWERFWTLADRHEVVAECVDSGFWRISVHDDLRAERIAQSIAAIQDVIITDLAR